MTVEHLQPLLDYVRDLRLFFQVVECMARGQVPDVIQGAIRMQAANWSCWADCLPMVQQRHLDVVERLATQLSSHPWSSCLQAVAEAKSDLTVSGFEAPCWHAFFLAQGARPPRREPKENEPAASVVEERAREVMFTTVSDQVKAITRSQGGFGAGAPFTALPTCRETTILSHLFRVLLLRRFRQQFYFTGRACRCGPLMFVATIVMLVPVRGSLGRRGYALESVTVRKCREAGGRERTNAFVRELD